ncbi:SPOSA6832_05005 [Sporobolomyces salmonicolor]|uniref:Peptide-methionine (R)-S-oxide reductase n=1 Tax=Sporidiobolus salmonicolor TaxID=5005 RepID=A0A0D6ETI5_SPOSA|nr:SPOSA6832_05005 [Sporobolomyces salmonicolor]
MLSRSSHSLLHTLTRPSTLVCASTTALTLSYVASPSIRTSLATLGSFHSSARSMSSQEYPVSKSDADWRLELSPEQYRVLRGKGTEMAGTGEYDSHYPDKGVYECAGCHAPLYTADTKFKSGCGWPAFFAAIPGAVRTESDRAFGMVRTELLCNNCGGHLGHLFKGEGCKHLFPQATPTRLRTSSLTQCFASGVTAFRSPTFRSVTLLSVPVPTPTDERAVSIKFNSNGEGTYEGGPKAKA